MCQNAWDPLRSTKHLVLLGGVLGVVTLFLPYLVVHLGEKTGSTSAFDVLRGLEQREGMQGLETRSTAYLAAMFAPAVGLFVLGLAGEMARRFGRFAGLIALLAGGWSCAMGYVLATAHVHLGELSNEPGTAAYTLCAAGAFGALGGLLALIAPDRRVSA